MCCQLFPGYTAIRYTPQGAARRKSLLGPLVLHFYSTEVSPSAIHSNLGLKSLSPLLLIPQFFFNVYLSSTPFDTCSAEYCVI